MGAFTCADVAAPPSPALPAVPSPATRTMIPFAWTRRTVCVPAVAQERGLRSMRLCDLQQYAHNTASSTPTLIRKNKTAASAGGICDDHSPVRLDARVESEAPVAA